MQTEAIRRAESMKSGSLTVSGFRIDNSLNTAAKVSVLRNGSNYSIPSDKKITETGRYEVNVTTPMGKSSRTVIYVDRSSVSDSLKRYFGSGALNGSKRIYSDGALPVYEGGSTTFHIEKTPANYLSVTGYIKNKTTGAYIYVTGSDDGYDIAITEAGKYEAVLRVDPFENSKAPSGDARIYRFNFEVITEGTAPGPLKNKQQLEKYGISNVSDLRPYYYGVTFPSAGSGDVTVAFADRDSAIEYAYNFEKGVVEDQGNGTFTYKGILSVGTRKKEFSDLWALTDAMYYFAEQAVSLEWFDLSREHTYLTLEDSVLQSVSNLRTLELARSVVIFADAEQKSALAVKDALPVICPKTRAVLALNGETLREKDDFIFIRDKNGYESHTVTVKDQTGKEFQLEYGKGAGQQLAELGCASGLITVTESTVYGDSTTYDAWFIRPEHNACELKIDYYLDDARYNLTLDMNSDEEVITADVFMFESIADALDGYSFISIVNDVNTLDQKILLVTDVEKLYLREKGSYLCTLVNRAGATFSFTVELRKDLDISISFSGEGTSHLGSISTYYSDEGVELPKIERYGYILKGYTDKYGNVYNGTIAKIMFKADTVLEPIWEAKRFILSFDSGVPSMEVAFGEEYTLPIPDSSRPDFGFVAWTDGEKRIEDNKFILCSESDVTLTAEFERTHSLIRFDSNGGQCVEYAICGLGETVALPIPTRDGFEFIGWSDSERKNFFYGSVLINSLGEVTLVANWEQIHEPEPQPETDEAEDQNIDKLPDENEGYTDGFKTEENREPVCGTLVNATVSGDISENAPASELPSDSVMDGESVGLADAPHPAVVAIIAVAGIFGACFIVFKITLLVSGG
ncbi:MAG: InlB B-repeat-containing protein [Clostridia bacterium]|nr:InlB B-repeat-containing protein [Clostridia bacterium]